MHKNPNPGNSGGILIAALIVALLVGFGIFLLVKTLSNQESPYENLGEEAGQLQYTATRAVQALAAEHNRQIEEAVSGNISTDAHSTKASDINQLSESLVNLSEEKARARQEKAEAFQEVMPGIK